MAASMTDSCVASAAAEGRHEPALPHDEHAVGHAEHLGQLAADHQDRQAARRLLAEQAVHLGLRPDVDATRRLVDDEQLGLGREPLGEHDLLLVAAAQPLHALLEPGVLELELLGPVGRESALRRGLTSPNRRSLLSTTMEEFRAMDAGMNRPC